MSDDLRAAVAAGVVGSEESFRTLLQSVVEVARAIFGAKASSIFLLDEEADELVFEAVAGEGAETLIGQRFPSSTGVAGWVLVTRQSLVIEDVTADPRFSKDVAESTGYVPKGLMAVPLLHEEEVLGVLEVLDRPERSQFSLVEMDLLGLFANQAAIALDLMRRARRAEQVLAESGTGSDVVARLAATVDGLQDERREAGLKLLGALEEVLRRDEGGY
ncbi:MAG TPA: GAF domain-containing protein [Gaiellaceae bacterium]|nr:GAF domain-containing protein [Gaiellaceae bacterium]